MRIIGNDPSTPRQAQIVASGTLSTGDAVAVNADGTVSVVAGVVGGFGTATTFNGNLSWISAVFDSTANKVIVAYQDRSNSFYGTAIVGTVSGTSISFGSKTVFESAQTEEISAIYDITNDKVVIAYKDSGNSDYGTAIVGTVSGTSISFGSATVFESANTTNISAGYDSANSKTVISYRDGGNSEYGTAIVGTVSGSSISFGSAAVFVSAVAGGISTGYDSNSSKIVVSYRNGSDSNAYAIVGTVSGTSISFGTAVSFSSNGEDTKIAFDSNSNKIVIAYKDGGNSDYGTAVVGTVSGTSISFGSSVVFLAASVSAISTIFDSNANVVVISYVDGGNSSYPTVIAGTVSGTSISFGTSTVTASAFSNSTSIAFDSNSNKNVLAYNAYIGSYSGYGVTFSPDSTNLTANNYIGTAASGAADTQRAKINLKGAVDENQSGLTAGQSYYVQTDGTLSTTPADPSVFAGTAVAATKLIVKG